MLTMLILSPGGRSLRLMHTAVEDSGRYTCVVINIAGEERKNFDLDVLGKDNHIQKLLNYCQCEEMRQLTQ